MCVPAPSAVGPAQPGERAGAAGRRARRGVPRRALPRTEDGQCAQVRHFFLLILMDLLFFVLALKKNIQLR